VNIKKAVLFSGAMNDSEQEARYFPAGLFSTRPKIDELKSTWYSMHLSAMHEPSFWELSKTQGAQFYRFLWIGTWSAPFAVRLEISSDGVACLYGWVTSGFGGYGSGSLSSAETKVLNQEQSKEFGDRIAASGFWNLPTRDDSNGLDGAQWIFEGVRDGQYHLVDRWSLTDGTLRDLGLFFLSLSGLAISPDKLY
jgi:hypothetical protein